MYQPHLVKRIIDAIPGMDRANQHSGLTSTSATLIKDVKGEKRKEDWESKDGVKPKLGINMKPDMSRGLEVYVDASFAGDWEI
eukprot:4387288-Ditylum_brightwellii.AAC.1